MMAGRVRFGKKVYFLNETEQQMEKKKRQEDLQRLHDFRPIDDDFMRCLFKDNIPLVELVLRIITGKQDLVITECERSEERRVGKECRL